MDIRSIAAGLALLALTPGLALAEEDALKKAETAEKKAAKAEVRLERKCAHEKEKDLRDAARGRKRARPDDKWDELCVPPPPPPPPLPPSVPPPPPPPPLPPL